MTATAVNTTSGMPPISDQLRRSSLDRLLIAAGVLVAVVMVVAGGLLMGLQPPAATCVTS